MIIVCTASDDTYITNKIINGSFLATDANVGRAGTLDLFKLYNETALLGVTGQTELSRVLVKFDLQPIFDLTGTAININSTSFKAYLQLFDIVGGSSTPANFNLVAYPLSQSFDEGIGRDLSSFNDLDVANFTTASFTNQNNLWFVTGANAGGLLGSNDIDYISSGNLGSGVVDLFATQNFVRGNEDLSIDVTKIVSATITGKIPNNGFRISYSASEEADQKTRFVKRFASRHVSNPLLRPKILVQYDNTIIDSSNNFTFDSSGTIFLQNFQGSSPANIVSGSALTPVTGLNCVILNLTKGNFSFVSTGSQHRAGTDNSFLNGVYSASFAIPSNLQNIVTGTVTLASIIAASGSVEFQTFWNSLDGTFCYYTGSLTVSRAERAQGNFTTRRPYLTVVNANPYYNTKDVVRFRVFGSDLTQQFNEPVKRPRVISSTIYEKVYYQVIDRFTGNVIIPYDNTNNSTRLSTDSQGMFFDFYMQSLVPGRSYGFQFLVVERDQTYLSREDETYFDVRP
jgi:hypothetical protein